MIVSSWALFVGIAGSSGSPLTTMLRAFDNNEVSIGLAKHVPEADLKAALHRRSSSLRAVDKQIIRWALAV